MAVLGEVTAGAQPSSPGPRQGEGRGPCERVSTASVRTREALQRLSSEAPDMRVAGGHVCVFVHVQVWVVFVKITSILQVSTCYQDRISLGETHPARARRWNSFRL